MRLAIVGFGLAMLSGAALAEVSAPAIVTPEKVRPIECRVSVTFAKEGTVTAVLRNQDFDSVTVGEGHFLLHFFTNIRLLKTCNLLLCIHREAISQTGAENIPRRSLKIWDSIKSVIGFLYFIREPKTC